MLNDVSGFKKVYVLTGRTDLRKGIDGLAAIIKQKFDLNPFDSGTLFLFCGTRTNKIKGLLWEEDGFLLVYKRLEAGSYQWPRNKEEARNISLEQFQYLMKGFSIDPPVRKVHPKSVL